ALQRADNLVWGAKRGGPARRGRPDALRVRDFARRAAGAGEGVFRGGVGPYSSMHHKNLSPRRKSCRPTSAGEASTLSSIALVARTSRRSLCFKTAVTPSRSVK